MLLMIYNCAINGAPDEQLKMAGTQLHWREALSAEVERILK